MYDTKMIADLGRVVKKGNVAHIGMMIKGWIDKATQEGYKSGLEDGYNKALLEIYDKYDTDNAILMTPEMYDDLRQYSYKELENMDGITMQQLS